jgi:hypothetical protein
MMDCPSVMRLDVTEEKSEVHCSERREKSACVDEVAHVASKMHKAYLH